jgi:hypothetical protein
LASGLLALGQNAPLERLGRPLGRLNIPVVWKAATNNLPTAIWTYRALPAELPPTVVSNLVVLGSFTARDRGSVPGYPNTISYADPTGKRTLWIVPEWSDIRYKNLAADDMHQVEGLPNEAEALALATNLFPLLGIAPSQLAKKPGGELKTFFSSREATLRRKEGGLAYTTNLHQRGVIFMRALDGIPVYGLNSRGGCAIEFGHHAQIAEISISWRNLKRDKSYLVLGPSDLVKSILDGKAVWQVAADWPSPEWPSVKRLTITKATPYYHGEARGEAEKPANRVLPFIQLEATVETGETNTPVLLNCPIISPGKP